ncbi:MAG: ribonuclease R [Bacilli bacterium]|nr:ribonuclease R [Bacilli bacterium]
MKEQILNVLSDRYEALDIIAINDLLTLNTPEELKELTKAIDSLVKENLLYKTKKDKYILFKNCPNLKVGIISIKKSGCGFLLVDDGEDVYIDKSNVNAAINDDKVLIELINNYGEIEGKVLRVLDRDLDHLIGEVYYVKEKPYLKLEDEKKRIEIKLDDKTTKGVVEGTKVVASIIKEMARNKYLAKITTVIGHKDDPGVDIKLVAYKYSIYEEFSNEAMKQTEEVPIEVEKKDLIGRVDLTNECIFTIDGDDTKDIDDAISYEYKDGLHILGVHIADVSYYVLENTPLDKDALIRGTSSYLADSVIPMLPHKLSNGICSLNEGVIRLTQSCVMKINDKGNVVDYDIFPSYIKSRKKMTYKKVNDIIMRDIVDPLYTDYVDVLKGMNNLAHILRKNKIGRGYIDFGIDEAKVVVDDNKKVIGIERRIREDGEKLIEDFMIAANETVATHIFNMSLPFLYRVHDVPNIIKIEKFIRMVSLLGYKLTGKIKDLTPISMQKILEQLKDVPEYEVLSSMLLRSMRKAVYQKDNIGHFGLGSKCYTHFTSPIRRYPDLMVHRLLRTYLYNHDLDNKTLDYYLENLDFICNQSSEREQAAVDAEREVMDMKMAEYMENHIGEEYEGIISGVENFGMFVELDNLVEGLVHISSIKGDYYNYVEELMSLIGQNTKKRYRIGDKVKIKVVGASKEAKTIDFELVGDKDDRDSK